MSKEHPNTMICTSIFKDGGSIISKSEFTKIWISLINRIEKNKMTMCEK